MTGRTPPTQLRGGPYSLFGVLLARAGDGRLPADASALEGALWSLLDVPRSAVALCSRVDRPPSEIADALRRLIDAGAIRPRRARGVSGSPAPDTLRSPGEQHVDSPSTRCRTLTMEELRAALDVD